MKFMALWGEPGAMIDACIHLPWPLMTLTCNNNIVSSQCTSNSAAIHEQVNRNLYRYVIKAGI